VADPKFLLDTNILIYLLEGAAEPLRQRVEGHAPGALVTSSLCVAEALYGLGEKGFSILAPLLAVVRPLPFDLEAAQAFPRVSPGRGRTDRFIAAHALSLGLVLVTNNPRDFADVVDLKIENWVEE
jgi:tRNA(fMet)-specific endonuclease VapC